MPENMKNKALGHYGVTNEQMKYGGETKVKTSIKLYNKILDKQTIPED